MARTKNVNVSNNPHRKRTVREGKRSVREEEVQPEIEAEDGGNSSATTLAKGVFDYTVKTKGGRVKKKGCVLETQLRKCGRHPPNVNCRVETFGRMVAKFRQHEKKWVNEMGFGGLLWLQGRGLPRNLCYWVMTLFDPYRLVMKFPGDIDYPIHKSQVRWVFGIPHGPKSVPLLIKGRKMRKVVEEIEREYGSLVKFRNNVNTVIEIGDVRRRLELGFDESQEKEFKLAFMIIVLGDILCPTTSTRISKSLYPAIAVAMGSDDYDWCQLVVDRLAFSGKNFASRFYDDGFARGAGGCTYFLAILYLDHLYRTPIDWDAYPRVRVWSTKKVNEARAEDRYEHRGDYGKLGCMSVPYGRRHPFVAEDTMGPDRSSHSLAFEVSRLVLSGIGVDPAGSSARAGHAMYYSDEDDDDIEVGEQPPVKRRRTGPADSTNRFVRKQVDLSFLVADEDISSADDGEWDVESEERSEAESLDTEEFLINDGEDDDGEVGGGGADAGGVDAGGVDARGVDAGGDEEGGAEGGVDAGGAEGDGDLIDEGVDARGAEGAKGVEFERCEREEAVGGSDGVNQEGEVVIEPIDNEKGGGEKAGKKVGGNGEKSEVVVEDAQEESEDDTINIEKVVNTVCTEFGGGEFDKENAVFSQEGDGSKYVFQSAVEGVEGGNTVDAALNEEGQAARNGEAAFTEEAPQGVGIEAEGGGEDGQPPRHVSVKISRRRRGKKISSKFKDKDFETNIFPRPHRQMRSRIMKFLTGLSRRSTCRDVMLKCGDQEASVLNCRSVLCQSGGVDDNFVRVVAKMNTISWQERYKGCSSRLMLDPTLAIRLLGEKSDDPEDWTTTSRVAKSCAKPFAGIPLRSDRIFVVFVPVLEKSHWWCAGYCLNSQEIWMIDSASRAPIAEHSVFVTKLNFVIDKFLYALDSSWVCGQICSWNSKVVKVDHQEDGFSCGVYMLGAINACAERFRDEFGFEDCIENEREWLLTSYLMSEFNEAKEDVKNLVTKGDDSDAEE